MKVYLLRLRKILLSNIPYLILFAFTIMTVVIRLLIPQTSKYNDNTTTITGTITSITIKEEQVKITLQAKEKILLTYYLKEREIFKYNLGDKIKVFGTIKVPEKNKAKNLFNYQKYLKRKDIYYIFKVTSIKKITNNKNIYYFIKQKLITYLDDPYLSTFIIGDKSKISKEVTTSYQKNGISHLFAISGMHITLLSSIILKILKKIKVRETKRYFITSIILLFYLAITNFSASILRGVLFFILFSINKIYYFYIKPTNLFLIATSITLLINENFLFDIGFLYSYSISLALIIMAKYINSKNYFLSLLKTSILAFIISLPISLYNFFEINFLSIIYNLIFVPFVSYIVFPLSLITFIFPIILPLFSLTTIILEKLSLTLSKITILTFSFPRLNILIYILYIIFIIISYLFIITKKKKNIYPLILLILFHYIYPYFSRNTYLKIINVGQGDSSVLHLKNKTVLIDTGGILSYKDNNSYSITSQITIPLLKSYGIRKIDYLILTHGDYDHMGEATNLVNNFKVEKVIFNCGEFNELEIDLIRVLEKKKIPYYSCIKELNIDDNKFHFLNDKDYGNENDNSSVIYTELNNYKFLFMGDAGVEVEEDLIEKYNLQNIDVLKVGHHGSKTSSGQKFIDEINPKYGVISVGKNNRYGHPNDNVLDNLEDSKIYRTDYDGSIMFKIKKNKIDIETCSP